MAGDEYLKLDLSLNGEIARDLFDRLDSEASRKEIMLTGDGDAGSWSENFTPAMRSWFGIHIAAVRQKMLGEINQQARQFELGNRDGVVTGIAYPIEIDRIDRDLNWEVSKLYSSFRERYGAELEGKQQLASEYGRMRGRIGKDAINKNFITRMAPPTLAGIVEGIFNYSNLIDVLPTGLISLGVTLVIMLVVGFGVHFMGKGLAERSYRRESSRDDKNRNMLYIFGGLAALVIILAIVFAIRYIGLQEDIQKAVLIGVEPPNLFLTIIQLVGFNLAIYLVGVIVTTKQYDPNPDFAELAEKLNEASDNLARLKTKHVYGPKQELEEKFGKLKKERATQAAQMDGMEGFAALQQELNTLEEQDNRVIGLLNEYRHRLQEAIEPVNANFKFKKNSNQSFADDSAEDLSLAEFASSRLYLYKAEA